MLHPDALWLAPQSSAVIKIAKKHDKTAKTKLFMPVCRVLLTQAFVKGMTSSSVFDPTKSTATSSAAADV